MPQCEFGERPVGRHSPAPHMPLCPPAAGWAVHGGGPETTPGRILLALFARLPAQTGTHHSKRLKALNSLRPSFRKFPYGMMHSLAPPPSLEGRRQAEIPSDTYKKQTALPPICLIPGSIPCVRLGVIYQLVLSFVIPDTSVKTLKHCQKEFT